MLSVSFSSGDFAPAASVVGRAHLGAIYTTFFSLEAFDRQRDLVGTTHVRWPGGTRGETGRDFADTDRDGDTSEYLFDLRHDDLLTVPGKGLSDMLEYAREEKAALSIFVPSLRYLDEPRAGARDVSSFMDRLLGGHFGKMPESLTIEIGNETLDGTIARAVEYGAVANAQIRAIRKALEGTGLDLDIALQIGRTEEEDAAIRAEIGAANLRVIDSLIVHHLPINILNHNKIRSATSALDNGDSRFTRTADYVDAWERAVQDVGAGERVNLDLFVSAWTVGPSDEVSDSDLPWQDIGARQGRTVIDTFAQLVGNGADRMALWGIDARSNPNAFSRPDENGIHLSHGGVAFQMMAEALPGHRLMDGFHQPWTDTGREEVDAWVYAFEAADRYTLFVVANEIERPARVRISLEGIDETRAVSVRTLATHISDDAPRRLPEDERRLYEEPNVTLSMLNIAADTFVFRVEEAFEVNRLTVWKDDAEAETVASQSGARGSVAAEGIHVMIGGTEPDELTDLARIDDPLIADLFPGL